MIVSAKMILKNPIFQNPTVLMLVDRNELEAQLFNNLNSVGFESVTIIENKEKLRKRLASNQ